MDLGNKTVKSGEAAEYLLISRQTLISLHNRGILVPEVISSSGHRRYTIKQLQEYKRKYGNIDTESISNFEKSADDTVCSDEFELLSAKDVMKYLKIAPLSLKRLEESGELVPYMKLPTSGKRFYKRVEVYAYAYTTLAGNDSVYKLTSL